MTFLIDHYALCVEPSMESVSKIEDVPKEDLPKIVEPYAFGSADKSTLGITFLSAGVLLASWWGVSHSGFVAPLFLPTPEAVYKAAVTVIRDGYSGATFFEHVSASLLRMTSAAIIACSLAIPIGLLMGINRWFKGVFDAPIEFYWPLPPLAYLPLMIIWLGIDEASKITLLVLAIFAPVCLAAQAGVKSIPLERINTALSLGATRTQLLRTIVFPSALPDIMTGIRIGLGVGWSTLVAAELIAATKGIGFMTLAASHFLATEVVFFGIFIIALCAFSFSWVMRILENRLVSWRGQI